MLELHAQFLVQQNALLARCAANPDEAGEKLLQLAELTLGMNDKINLTADDTPELFWQRHIADSLWAAAVVAEALPEAINNRPMLDVGSGGGMPGLVWGILWPGAPLSLLEARRRRAEWLSAACASLGLKNTQVLTARAESAGQEPDQREQYGLVTARALARLATLLELTLPLTRIGGHVAAIKSADCLEEVREAEFALNELGSDHEKIEFLPYRRSDGKQCVVLLIPKLRATPAAYPRREGVPARHPL
jgi:16S rRNA (guanine527-N7)-methyltransferase